MQRGAFAGLGLDEAEVEIAVVLDRRQQFLVLDHAAADDVVEIALVTGNERVDKSLGARFQLDKAANPLALHIFRRGVDPIDHFILPRYPLRARSTDGE